MTHIHILFNYDCENVSFCRSFVVSAVFAQRTFDAGFPQGGHKFKNNLQKHSLNSYVENIVYNQNSNSLFKDNKIT